jgi:NADH-quinone oxidoreductase subunit L
LTALFAATIACVQKDIKRVLAYSTMSQIAYMFMGESAGGFSTGIFHLTTHAYFKALLFMCAGAVIHALGGEQDMSKMGGLRRKLPLTFWCFVIGGLALAAIAPFAGFWSKDAILGVLLSKATANGGQPGWWILYGSGLLTAILTGFYTFRLIFGVFLHEYRGPEIAAHSTRETAQRQARGATHRAAARRDPLANVHDVGPAMAIPMVILAVLSLVGGFYGTPWNNAIGAFLQPVTGSAPLLSPSSGLFWISIAAGLVAALLGIAIAWARYGRRQPAFGYTSSPLVSLLENRYYVDAIYDRAIVRPVEGLGAVTRRSVEGVALDGGSRGVGAAVNWSSRFLRGAQTGYVRTYALGIFLGAAAIILYFVAQR